MYREDNVTDRMCQKWFVKFLGTVDIFAKYFFAVGLSYALEEFSSTPGLYPLGTNSRRYPTYSKYRNQQSLEKIKNVSIILWKKMKWTFWPSRYYMDTF